LVVVKIFLQKKKIKIKIQFNYAATFIDSRQLKNNKTFITHTYIIYNYTAINILYLTDILINNA